MGAVLLLPDIQAIRQLIADLFPHQTTDTFHMGAPGEQIRSHGIFHPIAPLLQQRHIPAQGGRVTGDVDDAPGCHPVEGFDGIGI